MSDRSELPHAIAESVLNIMGVELKVCMLDNGMRVIEAESVKQFFEAMGSTDVQFAEDDAMRLARAIRGIPEPIPNETIGLGMEMIEDDNIGVMGIATEWCPHCGRHKFAGRKCTACKVDSGGVR